MPNKKVSTDLFITQILMNRRQCQVQVCQSAKSRDYLTVGSRLIKFSARELREVACLHKAAYTWCSPVKCERWQDLFRLQTLGQQCSSGSGCGSVGRVVTTDIRDLPFESSHRLSIVFKRRK